MRGDLGGGSGAAIRQLWDGGTTAGLGDTELLDRFARRGDQAAFSALVSRHGGLVAGVCRRVLGDEHAAEDASQAVFLVLAKRAGSVSRPDRLSAWLYGVALRTSRRAKTLTARRRSREAAAAANLRLFDDPPADDLRPVIDQELARLPEKYRAPVLLCDLGGRSIDEAAGVLGWPRGTVGTRLTRARGVLKTRLARRGVGLGAGLALSQFAGPTVSAAWVARTAQAATRYAAPGPAVAASTTTAVLLATYVTRSLTMTHWKLAAALAGTALLGGGLWTLRAGAERQPAALAFAVDPPPTPVDPNRPKGTWVVTSAMLDGRNSVKTNVWRRSVWAFGADNVRVKPLRGPDGTFASKFDPKALPRRVRLEPDAKPGQPTLTPGRPAIEAIYRLDGEDSLTIAWLEGPTATAPADFEVKPEPPDYLAVLKLIPEAKVAKVDPAVAAAEEQEMTRADANFRLRSVALAIHNFVSVNDHLPAPAIRSAEGKPLLSWRVDVLQFLGDPSAAALYKEFHLDEPWDGPHNKTLLTKIPAAYTPRDPSDVVGGTEIKVFVGPGALFEDEGNVTFGSVTDGLTPTLMAVQAGPHVPWTKPEDIAFSPDKPLPKLVGPLKGGVLALMGDGSIQFISDEAKPWTIVSGVVRNDGKGVTREDLAPKAK